MCLFWHSPDPPGGMRRAGQLLQHTHWARHKEAWYLQRCGFACPTSTLLLEHQIPLQVPANVPGAPTPNQSTCLGNPNHGSISPCPGTGDSSATTAPSARGSSELGPSCPGDWGSEALPRQGAV